MISRVPDNILRNRKFCGENNYLPFMNFSDRKKSIKKLIVMGQNFSNWDPIFIVFVAHFTAS